MSPVRSFLSAVLLPAALALASTGCTEEDYVVPSIRPSWTANQVFHLETRYNHSAVRTERGNTTADPAADSLDATVDLSEDNWSNPIYWRYQVLDQGLQPAEGEDFYEYATKGGTESPLTVIKASLDPSMNLGGELVESDPKIYLVIREDRLRLAGLVYFYTLNGERISDAVTVNDDEMNRSFSVLSQSNLSIIPHFVPPFPIAAEDKDMELEDGQVVSFSNASTSSVDVVYENALDDTLIAETWENGQPWATWSVTPGIDSRLMDPSEVDEIIGFDNHEDPEDFDFVDLLKQPLNLSAALYVDDMIGSSSFQVVDGYRPWAGSWWPQSEGKLIFGYLASENDTVSEVEKASFEPLARDIQTLGDELRQLRKDGQGDSAEYDSKVEEYREKQNQLVEGMVAFYGAIRNGIDGGQITVQDGHLSAPETWHPDYGAFDFEIDKLSPLDKFALIQQLEDSTHGTNPWFGPAWEILNHWSPAGSSWWGHCNGWAAAAILDHEPREPLQLHFGSTDQHVVELSTADQKGLLSESNYSGLSNFFGSRYNGDDGDDISDLSPKAVLQILSTYIGQRGVPLVFDTTAGEEVWNFPAWSYELTLTETTGAGAGGGTGSGLININTAGMAELQTLWGINEVRAERIIAYRQQNGPFQQPDEIVNVRGIGFGLFQRIEESITVSTSTDLRNFDGELRVRFATDGVGYSHIDPDPSNPNGFVKTWAFTLEASPAGEIIDGTWDDNEDGHPDFAWVPYSNSVNPGRSENPYLEWTDLLRYLTDANNGTSPVRD